MRKAVEEGDTETRQAVSRGKSQSGQRADRRQRSRCRSGRLTDRRGRLGSRR